MQPPNPYAPPQQYAPQQGYYPPQAPFMARIDGTSLVLSKNAFLPNVCVKCATYEPPMMARKRKVYMYVPLWGRLFGVVGMMLSRKTATLDLPLCPPCTARASQAQLVMWLVWIGMAVPVVLAFVVAGALNSDVVLALAWLLLLAAIAVPLTIFFAWARDRVLPQATRIDDVAITLVRVHPHAMGAAVQAAAQYAGYGQAPQYPQYPQQPQYPGYPPQQR